MFRVGRLLPQSAAGRRSYSVFSPKSGGGRYFNSTKPSSGKAITPSASNATVTPSNNSNNASTSAPSDTAPITEPSNSKQALGDVHTPNALNQTGKTGPSMMASFAPHPALSAMDLTLHRFFSQHRPCLLLNQPTNSLFESAPGFLTSAPTIPQAPLNTLDDPPVASAEADADTARQLSRSLVMSRVQNVVEWETALARLGLEEVKEPIPPIPEEISMDSTKRKRRKKMKKHK